MYELLVSFYKYGFVIIKNVPTNDNFIVKFANSIGSVRRTNFGEHFNVKSKSNPNVIYAGGETGGLYKSEDKALTWKSVGDDFHSSSSDVHGHKIQHSWLGLD